MRATWIGAAFLLAGCDSGKIEISGDTGAADDAAGDTDTADDTDSGADTGPEPSPWAGSYAGTVVISAADPEGQLHVICEGELVLEVDDAGDVVGTGACEDFTGEDAMLFDVTGATEESGSFDGAIVIVLRDDEEITEPLGGTFSESFEATWTGTVRSPRGDEIDYEGSIEAESGG